MLKNNKLTLIPAAYKTSKVYSQIPLNGDGDFSFTRNTKATRVNSNGFLEVMDANIPRLDYSNGNCPELLIERAATNLVPYSDNFSISNWNKISTTVDSNAEVSPDGTMSADKVQRTTTSSNYIRNSVSKSTSSAIDATASVFVKKGNSNYVAVRLTGTYPNRYEINYNFETGGLAKKATGSFVGIEAGFEDYGNGWIRLYLIATTDTTSNISISVSPKSDNLWVDSPDPFTDTYCYLWGAQIEESIRATTYIPTSGSASTRNTDTLTDLTNINVSSDDFTIFINADYTDLPKSFGCISINDGDDDNSIRIMNIVSTDEVRVTNLVGGTGVNNYNIYHSTWGYKLKIAIVSTWNGFDLYVNGELATSETSGTIDMSSMTSIGFTDGAGDNFLGRLKDFRYYNVTLTEQELITLTR